MIVAMRNGRRPTWPTLRAGPLFSWLCCFTPRGAVALLARSNELTSDLLANAPVIMIDLAPEAVAPRRHRRTNCRPARSRPRPSRNPSRTEADRKIEIKPDP